MIRELETALAATALRPVGTVAQLLIRNGRLSGVAATAAPISTAASSMSTAATLAFRSRPRFVDGQPSALQLGAIEGRDGIVAAVGHFDKPKAARTSRFAV
jgi:hypothetical protein